jgi:hypothetical protein
MSVTALVWLLVWALVLIGLVILAMWLIDVLGAETGWPPRLTKILKVIVAVVAALIVIGWLVAYLPGPPWPPHAMLDGLAALG